MPLSSSSSTVGVSSSNGNESSTASSWGYGLRRARSRAQTASMFAIASSSFIPPPQLIHHHGAPSSRSNNRQQLPTKAPRPTPTPDMPTPPSHVNQQKLLDALRLWIREGEQCVVDYRTKLETWRRCHTKVCQEDVEELRNHIRFLEKQIEERQISSMKEMDPVLVEANGWIVEQEERLADARQTMDALVAVGKNTTSSFESTTTPVLVPPTNADGGAGPSQSDPPSELLCPITLDLMKDPVIAADGHTYERSAIEQVFNQSTNRSNNPVSPCTNLSLPSRALIPNVGIRSMCRRWDNSNNDNTAVVVMEELPPTG